MNISPRQPSKESKFVRGRRDLATPQGLTLIKTIALCAVFSIVADIVGRRVGIKTDLLYGILIVINIVVFGLVVVRMAIMNKKTLEKQRKQQK